MNLFPYIAIEGVIGVGKTTLARYLQEDLQAELLLEVFEENPFLGSFYADRDRYAFQTQIFFLLSRYRQQHEVLAQSLTHTSVVSDYFFAKDQLFARLNLHGDELNVYESVYTALAERIPHPSLVVYLQADVDILMERIAIRDRSYERNMSRDYIASLYQAYERLFENFAQAPVITINTNTLNIVHDVGARREVLGQIKAAIQTGASQPPLPHLEEGHPPENDLWGQKRLADFQRFHTYLDELKDFTTDLYLNYILLVEEVGELGRDLAHVWTAEHRPKGDGLPLSQTSALKQHQAELKGELADCLAYLIKLANYTGIDLEQAYIEKMEHNIDRVWPDKHKGTGV